MKSQCNVLTMTLQASHYIKEAMEQMEDEDEDDDPDGMVA